MVEEEEGDLLECESEGKNSSDGLLDNDITNTHIKSSPKSPIIRVSATLAF